MKSLLRLIKIMSPFKYWMLLSAILGFLTIGSSIGLMMTAAYIIAKAALHPSIHVLQVGIVGVRFFGIVRGVFRYLERLISHDLTFKLLARLRVWFYKAVEPLAPAGLSQYKRSDLMHRIVSDIEQLEHIFIRILAPPLVAVFTSLLMWPLLGIYDPVLALVLFLCHLLAGIGVPLFTLYINRTLGPKLVKLKAELNTMVIDGIQGMSDLMIFGQDKNHFEKLHQVNHAYIRTQRKYESLLSLHESLIGLIMNGAVVLMLAIAVPHVHAGSLDGVFLAVIVLGVMASFEAILPLPGVFTHLDATVSAADRIFQIRDSQPVVKPGAATIPETESSDIEFKNVSFAYPQHEQPVLKNISLTIPARGKIAVAGPSGAGKSTLIHLLLRFYDYQDGTILFGNRELRHLSEDAVREQISVVRQHTHIFTDTLKNNLLIANPDASGADLLKVIEQVQLTGVLNNLKNGLDGWIGEHGFTLSGGERQRIAIARALLKNSPVLILDEFTANLDPVTEQHILEMVLKNAAQKTVIWITHRLIHLSQVDDIYLIYEGNIIEKGTYQNLMALNGYFKSMVDVQRQEKLIIDGINLSYRR